MPVFTAVLMLGAHQFDCDREELLGFSVLTGNGHAPVTAGVKKSN